MNEKEKIIREAIKNMYLAARASICHCFDHNSGAFPEDCDCEQRQRIVEAYAKLDEIYDETVEKVKNLLNG